MIYNNKVIENIDLDDIKNMMKDVVGCNNDSISFSDLKSAFDMNMQLQEKINSYRDERVNKFASENTDNYKVIFHAIPIDAFSKQHIDLKKARNALQNKSFFKGIQYSNFEGLYGDNSPFHMKLCRNSIFEAIYEEKKHENVHVHYSKNKFKEFVNECLEVYDELNISCSIAFFVTFTNVNGRKMAINSRESYGLRDAKIDILNPAGVIIKDKK